MKKSVTIIISHYESFPFLRRCLEQIEKHRHPEIEQRVLVLDQSQSEVYGQLIKMLDEYNANYTLAMKPLYSGYGIDYALRNHKITTEYICQLHADAFPISDNWLRLPITLMEENNLSFTGVLQFIADGSQSIYPPTKGVFGMAQCFNIGKTDIYREMSLNGGFTRFHNRRQAGFEYLNDDWNKWAETKYADRGSDDDVPAFFWQDNYREDDKLSFGFTGKMGREREESNYGTIIEDLVFHFGFHREAVGVMPQMGPKYQEWTRKINENYSDDLIAEMLAEARKQPLKPENGRLFWDGKKKKASLSSHSLNERILQLKNGR